MKTYKILFGLLSLVSFTACTGDEMKKMVESATSVAEINQILATVADYGTTRSELYREDDAIKFRWSVGDTLGIFPDSGNQVGFAISDEQAGSLTAVFDGGGWALKPSHTYSVYFPFIGNMYLPKDNIPLDYTGQCQTSKNSYTHLGKYDYLASDAVTPNTGKLAFTMNHLGSIMLLKLKSSETGTFTSMTLIADNDVFTSKAKLNIAGETPVVTATEQSNNITLQLQGVTTSSADEEFTLSMMTLPVDLTSETLSVFLTRDDGTIFSGYIEEPKNIEQGKPYEMTAELTIGGVISDDWIEFADAEVKAICVDNWDTNGDGELSYKEAAAVTDIGNKFLGKTKIKSFDEFQYFTGVQSVQERAFQACIGLESITLPNSLKSTSNYMFNGCQSLKEISITNSITSIGDYAFASCKNLKEILLPSSLTSIGLDAFNGCESLIDISIPESVVDINVRAFYGCSSLTSITIPSQVSRINSQLFEGCSSLSSVLLSPIITAIENMAFKDCTSIETITLPKNLIEMGGGVFEGCTNLKSITIPEYISILCSYVFSGCTSLTQIDLPSGLLKIEDHAFEGCTSLINISFPEAITSIGYAAFSGCSSLTSITCLPIYPPIIGAEPFNYGSQNTIYVPSASIDAYKTANGWSDYADNIKPIITPASFIDFKDSLVKDICVTNWDTNGDGELSYDEAAAVSDIGDKFSDNPSIKSFDELQYFTSVTTIGDYAFYFCSSLTSVVIPDGVTSIGSSSFEGCSSLTNILMPDGVATIGEAAFQNCSSLTSIEIPDGVTSIGGGAFASCSSLASIVIPDGVTSIGDSAFSGCSMTNIVIPDGVTSIGNYAFASCSSLASIEIPDGVTSIGNYAFYECFKLTSIEIPDGVTSIGNYAFRNCSRLTSIVLPAGMTSIGISAFYDCNIMACTCLSINPPSIGSNAFSNKTGYLAIYVPSASVDAYKTAEGWSSYANIIQAIQE